VDALRQLLEIKNNDVDALFLLATCEFRRGMHTEAMAAVKRILEIDPGNEDATANLAYIEQGVHAQ
jgi:cytochrome c-type biogenesis protein CcmH/NrfG